MKNPFTPITLEPVNKYNRFGQKEGIAYHAYARTRGGAYISKTRQQIYDSELELSRIGLGNEFMSGLAINHDEMYSPLEISIPQSNLEHGDMTNLKSKLIGFRIVRNKQ